MYEERKMEIEEYYVYAWYNEEEIIYIGKGKGNRAFRNSLVKVEIISSNLTQEEAHNFEKILIKKIGRKDLGLGPLINRNDGGYGGDNSMYIDYSKTGDLISKSKQTSFYKENIEPQRAKNVSKTFSDPDWKDAVGKQRSKKISDSWTHERRKKQAERLSKVGSNKRYVNCDKCGLRLTVQNLKRHQEGPNCAN